MRNYTTTNGLLSNHIESMVQDEQGYLWIATVNGLQRFDGHSFVNFRHIKETSVVVLVIPLVSK